MNIRRVGVAGCGLMGSGIAQVAAQAGFQTAVLEVDRGLLEKGKAGVGAFLARGVEKGKITPADRDAVLERMNWTTEVKDLGTCDLVIEAIIEDLAAKRRLFEALDRECGPETILASNTSSLSITEMAAGTKRPSRFIGLHFFNPVPLMPLVEVVRTLMTDERVFETAVEFGARLGKTPIRTSDRTGFVVNRLLVPYLLDAVRALEEGVGSIVDIDNGMKLGCGYPMGPFTLLDLVGLDTTASIAEIFYGEFREARYATPPLLKRMVMSGFLGKKSGKGFYGYATGVPVPNDFLVSSRGMGA